MDSQIQKLNNEDNTMQDNSLENLILDCNKVAMEHLRNENFQQAIDLLKKAEKLLIHEYQNNPNESIYRLIGITLNNLGCYYKRIAKPKVALKYLKKALQVEIFSLDEKSSIAGTHLNICAILSSLNDHEQAVKHAKLALEIIEVARKNILNGMKDSNELDNIKHDNYKSLSTTMIIAYYNMGIEFEYLKQFNIATQAFTKGYQLALKDLGNDHPMTKSLHKSMMSLFDKNQKVEEENNKKNETNVRRLEQNKGIRYQSEKRNNFSIDDEIDSKQKVVDYGYDGHRKVVYKSSSRTKRNLDLFKASNAYSTSNKLPRIYNKFELNDMSFTKNNISSIHNDRIDEVDENAFIGSDNNLPRLNIMNTLPKTDQRYIVSNIKRNSYDKGKSTIKEDPQFYSTINKQINDLDNKINKTLNDISAISNDDGTNENKPKEFRKNGSREKNFKTLEKILTNGSDSATREKNISSGNSNRLNRGSSKGLNHTLDLRISNSQIGKNGMNNSNLELIDGEFQNDYTGPLGGGDDKEPVYLTQTTKQII